MKKVAILFWLIFTFSCTKESKNGYNMKIEEAVRMADPWLDIKGVVGVAQSKEKGKDIILVLISTKPDSLEAAIPATYYGHKVVLKEVGEINAQ